MAKKSKSVLKSRKSFSGLQVLIFTLAFAAVGAVAVWQSLAAPHNGGGKSGKGAVYTGAVSGPVMVTDKNSDGLPNNFDIITFSVTSTAPNPFVRVDCSQNGILVWSATQGFWPGWLWGHDYNLGGANWSPGEADCVATLFYQTTTNKGTTQTQMGSPLNFHVNA